MHEIHQGKLKSGRSDKKGIDPKQAILILFQARAEGKTIPKKKVQFFF